MKDRDAHHNSRDCKQLLGAASALLLRAAGVPLLLVASFLRAVSECFPILR